MRKTLLTFIVVPLLFYFVSFSILTYPQITHVATDCYCDQGDGYTALWNLWWINQAVTVTHRSPLESNYLYFPASLQLVVHDLDLFNDFIGIVLYRFVALPQIYNLLFIAGFLLTGLFTFALALHLTQNYLASLLAGFAFTFSNFHFAQAWMSHLPFISLYWIPLFALCWYRFLERPTYWRASIVALIVAGAGLTNFYLLFYVILLGLIIFVAHLLRHRDLAVLWRPMLVFVAIALITTGPIVADFLIVSRTDPIQVDPYTSDDLSGHSAKDFSTDPLALFVPAGRLGNAILSGAAGHAVNYTYAEHNSYLGWIVLAMVLLVVIRWRRGTAAPSKTIIGFWLIMLIVFILLSFGPLLHIGGVEIPGIPMPYSLLGAIPIFSTTGVPGRFAAISVLAAAIVAAFGFKMIFEGASPTRRNIIFGIITILFFVEYFPLPMWINPAPIAPFVSVLQQQSDPGGVIDAVTPGASAIYFQTYHDKPIGISYTSRVTRSVSQVAQKVKALLLGGQYASLCRDYGYRYLVVSPATPVDPSDGKLLYKDDTDALYALLCDANALSK